MSEFVAMLWDYSLFSANSFALFFARLGLLALTHYPINLAIILLITIWVGFKLMKNVLKVREEKNEAIQMGKAVDKMETIGEIKGMQKEIEGVHQELAKLKAMFNSEGINPP